MLFAVTTKLLKQYSILNNSEYNDDTTQYVQLLNHIKTTSEQNILTVNVLRVHSIISHDYNELLSFAKTGSY